MNRGVLEEENRLLKERVIFLEREILRLSSGRLHPTTQAAETWEVIEDESFSDWVPVTAPPGFSAEDGPPAVPLICKDLAERNLKPGKFSPLQRAEAAFETGFWIRIALETSTPFQDTQSLKGLNPAHWIVFRGALGGLPVRSTRKSDCVKALWEEADSILVSVASLTELHIVCAGAGLSLPKQIRWRSQQ
jgi:hypothetical protein